VWLIQWAKSRSERNEFGVPIPNFGKVTDALYRGALPRPDGYRGLRERLGVRRVLSIIEHESEEDCRVALANGMEEWHHIAFSDRHAPEAPSVRRWLDYVRSADAQSPVFTHCRGGRHRTGVLVGVLRVTDCGWNREQAHWEMQRYGWYSALGHQPLLQWFLHEFDPKDFA
jgi:tyrosine-protein phosphatase SIW14